MYHIAWKYRGKYLDVTPCKYPVREIYMALLDEELPLLCEDGTMRLPKNPLIRYPMMVITKWHQTKWKQVHKQLMDAINMEDSLLFQLVAASLSPSFIFFPTRR